MFADGVVYAAVSKNLANGIGTWWEPHFSSTLFNNFHQQPPLMIWLQSFFFQVTGDSIYPERIYSLLTGILMLLLLATSWRHFNKDPGMRQLTWLPLLLWLVIPTVSWGLKNNVAENTMVIFDWLSVMFMIQFFEKKSQTLSFFLAVIFLFAASFVKGFQGLFPFAAPACYWISTRKISFMKMIITTFILIAIIVFFYFLLLQIPAARKSYLEYFGARLSGFPTTTTSTTDNRLWLLLRMVIELSLPVTLSLAAGFLLQRKLFFKNLPGEVKSVALVFFLVGLSGSLPLLISYEQRGFYLITSMPYFVMSLALIVAPSFKLLIEKLSIRIKNLLVAQIVAWMFLISGIILTFLNAGKISRDQEQLHDVYWLKQAIGSNQIVGASEAVWNQWSLQAYFMRYANISLAISNDTCQFYLQLKSDTPLNLQSYQRLNWETKFVDVYERVK